MSKRGRAFLVLFLGYLGIVAWCCFGHFDSLPVVQSELFGIPMDKVVHFLMFLPFVFLGYMAFYSNSRKKWKSVLIALAVLAAGILIAAATELGQSLTDYRSGDPWDLAADISGLGLAFVLVVALVLIQKRKNR